MTTYSVLQYPDGKISVVPSDDAEHEIRLAGAKETYSGLPEWAAYTRRRWLKNRIRDWGKR